MYLDCEQTHADIFSLKWSLPQTGRVPITHSVLEGKDSSGEWKSLHGPILGTSFTFEGENCFAVSHNMTSASEAKCLSYSPSLHWLLKDKKKPTINL